MPMSPDIPASPLPTAVPTPADGAGIMGYIFVGAAAFLLGGAATVLCILLRRRKNGGDRRP